MLPLSLGGSPMACGGLLLVLFLLPSAGVFFSCRRVEGSIHEYGGRRFAPEGNAFILHGGSEGLYGPASSANASAPMNSFIRSMEAAAKAKTFGTRTSLSVNAIVFDVEDREKIGGSAYGGQRDICCTADLAKLGSCTEGTIIYRRSNSYPDWPQVLSASFKVDDLETTLLSKTLHVTKTRMYNLYFIYCDPALDGLEVDGKTIWKNPTGYLPGRMEPLIKFYGFMSLAFLILAVYWFSQYARFWTEVMPLQNCITLVIALGMIEMALWYSEYAEFNETGIRTKGITFWAVTFGAVKQTVSRLLILIVSMGYGIVRPTLGGFTSKVALLGGAFFLASEIFELVENVWTISDVPWKPILILALPVAILDAMFIIWIFISLSKTSKKLQARRFTGKQDIYRKFTNALIVTVIVSITWIAFELYFKATDAYGEKWQSAWMIPAFWQVLSFSVLCVICCLLAPSQNSLRYAYSDDGGEDFVNEANKSLIKTEPYPYKDSWSFSVSSDNKETTTPEDDEDGEEKRE
ncbi:hypothetical protein ZIOFF_028909 [Zingiber officinale]|uniref:GOST seven transmembrane domain-containing protein n=1 Tax=Zingiber officinale TaxID=94328 RepID=A0A8J5GWQ9_ZINOF|nr:hypothetical protein ZIOFF_028909 [Zingiber officinale]